VEPKVNSWELLQQNFYVLDAMRVFLGKDSTVKITQEHCDGCDGRLQGSFPPVTITVLLDTACCHHAVMVRQEHCCGRTFNRLDACLFCGPTSGVRTLKVQPGVTLE